MKKPSQCTAAENGDVAQGGTRLAGTEAAAALGCMAGGKHVCFAAVGGGLGDGGVDNLGGDQQTDPYVEFRLRKVRAQMSEKETHCAADQGVQKNTHHSLLTLTTNTFSRWCLVTGGVKKSETVFGGLPNFVAALFGLKAVAGLPIAWLFVRVEVGNDIGDTQCDLVNFFVLREVANGCGGPVVVIDSAINDVCGLNHSEVSPVRSVRAARHLDVAARELDDRRGGLRVSPVALELNKNGVFAVDDFCACHASLLRLRGLGGWRTLCIDQLGPDAVPVRRALMPFGKAGDALEVCAAISGNVAPGLPVPDRLLSFVEFRGDYGKATGRRDRVFNGVFRHAPMVHQTFSKSTTC